MNTMSNLLGRRKTAAAIVGDEKLKLPPEIWNIEKIVEKEGFMAKIFI